MRDSPPMVTLTIVDTTGIQDYIFGSNSLRHNVGASWLVHWATNEAIFAQLVGLEGANHTNIDEEGRFREKRVLGHDDILSELIYAGGGNAVILFQTRPLAEKFTRRLTRLVLEKAPGLQLVVTHVEMAWESDVLARKLDEVRQRANQKKGNRRHSVPLLGLSVTADCQYSSLPAAMEDPNDNGRRVAPELKAKTDHFPAAEQRLRKAIGGALAPDLNFARDFNQIGEPGSASYLAIVHIDGNGMGSRFEQLARDHAAASQNRAYIEALRRLSQRVKEIAQQALQQSVISLLRPDKEGSGLIAGKIAVRKNCLPFRPIVYGGDDVTFVCDGRLGLALAALYLREMEQPLANDPNDRLFVRAGVAVVNNHYPFARAYRLADELARSAKGLISEVSPAKQVSALDWHFAVNGLVLGLDELRARDYRTRDGNLMLRPLLLDAYGDKNRWRTWPFFQGLVDNFQHNPEWAERRSKVKAYGAALRAGSEAARQYLKAYLPEADLAKKATLLAPPGKADVAKCGWLVGERCVHFDAVEAADFLVALEPAPGVAEEER